MRFSSTLFALLLLATLPRLATAEPVLAFEERAAVVSGLTPQGQVVWFSVAKQIEGGMAHFVRREDVMPDTDGDGTVRFELDRIRPRKGSVRPGPGTCWGIWKGRPGPTASPPARHPRRGR